MLVLVLVLLLVVVDVFLRMSLVFWVQDGLRGCMCKCVCACACVRMQE